MKKLLALACVALTAGCAGTPALDLCKYSAIRRATYTTAITAADAYAASGRPVPSAMVLARDAAATALAVLDANCPAPS